MKNKILFIAFILIMLLALSLTAWAKETNVLALESDDILTAVNSSFDGDIINITLNDDIEISSNININKQITVNVNFNGYTLNYTGTDGASSSNGCFYVSHSEAILNLNGSNKLNSYLSYEHYSSDVKPDMLGTGNLIVVLHGSINIKNAYFLSNSNAWAIYCDMTSYNNYTINIDSSVLKTKEGAEKSAIASEGGNNYGAEVKCRKLIVENSVLYGGFKGESYCFNFTRGTAFNNVKLYDFSIKNDCWYNANDKSVASLLMNRVEDAVSMTNCLFLNYDGTTGDIVIFTETGKQNIKLYNCTFNSIKSGGSFKGDQGGDAYVYIIDVPSSCTKEGEMRYVKNGGNITSGGIVPVVPHTYENTNVKYPNGYKSNGIYYGKCLFCNSEGESTQVAEPIFVDLGYSINENNSGVTLGTRVNSELLRLLYKSDPDLTLDYGIIAGSQLTGISLLEGNVTVEKGFSKSLRGYFIDYINVSINGITDKLMDKPIMLEFYISDGEKIEYMENEPRLKTFNEIKKSLDRVTKEAEALLQTKHKLYYNEDGSFRVLILADLHVDSTSGAEKIQSLKDRIKFLVDKEEPNLVIFTGDNTIGSSSEERLRANISIMVSYIEEKKIPWCHVYGNHDHEGALSNARQQEIYESYEYCISKAGPESVSGTGNYVNAVYNKDGTIGSLIYCLDSGAYDSVNGGYDYIKESQIAWYEQSSLLIKEYNGGKTIKGIMAFHIPLIENNDAYNNRENKEIVYEWAGAKNEGICASKTDTRLLEAIMELGDIKAVITGHDHINDYMLNYKGVKLCSSPNISDMTYTNEKVQGGRVLDLNLESIDNVKTYVSYIIKRVTAEDYGTLEDNTLINDFEGEMPRVEVSGYNAATLPDSLSVSMNQNKGEGGSSCIEVNRSSTQNAEMYIYLDESSYGAIGNNKYLVVWMDLTGVDFRKACFGILSSEGVSSYRTDDHDKRSPFYYLADGESEWVSLSHGTDGCFGNGDSGSQSVKGLKGYLAFPLEYMLQAGKSINDKTLVTGIYMYMSLASGSEGKAFYIDNIKLVTDYKE